MHPRAVSGNTGGCAEDGWPGGRGGDSRLCFWGLVEGSERSPWCEKGAWPSLNQAKGRSQPPWPSIKAFLLWEAQPRRSHPALPLKSESSGKTPFHTQIRESLF